MYIRIIVEETEFNTKQFERLAFAREIALIADTNLCVNSYIKTLERTDDGDCRQQFVCIVPFSIHYRSVERDLIEKLLNPGDSEYFGTKLYPFIISCSVISNKEWEVERKDHLRSIGR